MSLNSQDFDFVPLEDNSSTAPASGRTRQDELVKISSIMSLVCQVIAVVIVVHLVYLCFDKISLFSLHPSCMVVGYLLFMTEAILALSNNAGLPVLQNLHKTTVHWILQVTATSFISVGFLAILIHKFQHDKLHFQTWHAFIGLFAVILIGFTNFGGLAALYAMSLKALIKPVVIKLIHAVFGILSVVLGFFTLSLGFYSNWFQRHSGESIGIVYSILIAGLCVRVLFNPIKNMSTRLSSSAK